MLRRVVADSPHRAWQAARIAVAGTLLSGGALLAGCAAAPATQPQPPAASSPSASSSPSDQTPGRSSSQSEERAPSAPATRPPTGRTAVGPSAGSAPAEGEERAGGAEESVSGGATALRLAPFTPGLSVRELRASGSVEFVGPFPFRYRIDFCPPEEFAANCPAPILGTATGPKQPFVAPFGGRPPTTQRYVIDVVVTVLDGSSKGAALRSAQGLVVNPNGAESGKRGRCASTAPTAGGGEDASAAVERR